MAKKVKNPSLYRSIHHMRHGGLHRWARTQGWKGTDEDKIPQEYIDKAKGSDVPHVQKMGHFAETLKSFKH